MSHAEESSKAVFAGGCFWCIESAFEKQDGVLAAVSGYIGGSRQDASYGDVSSGTTEHFEAVEVSFDSQKVSYEQLLDIFWRNIDPTQNDGQFSDKGPQYKTAIFYLNDEQKLKAEKSKKELAQNGPFKNPLVTPILPATVFYVAEEYHQDYYKKNATHYKTYQYLSGRGPFIKKTWKKK